MVQSVLGAEAEKPNGEAMGAKRAQESAPSSSPSRNMAVGDSEASNDAQEVQLSALQHMQGQLKSLVKQHVLKVLCPVSSPQLVTPASSGD